MHLLLVLIVHLLQAALATCCLRGHPLKVSVLASVLLATLLALVLLLAALLPTEPPLLLDPYCCWIPMTLQAATVLLTVILTLDLGLGLR